jgi:prevent-host-death family protein
VKESTIGVGEFGSKCLGLLDQVAKGNSLVITKHGRPIAKILPVSVTAKSLRGSWKGIVKINGDIVKFSEAGAWGVAEESVRRVADRHLGIVKK